jgi:hypothetical protein
VAARWSSGFSRLSASTPPGDAEAEAFAKTLETALRIIFAYPRLGHMWRVHRARRVHALALDKERLCAAWQEAVFALYLADGKIEPEVIRNMRAVDFVVDANLGPVVLEANARPGLNIQLANRRGLGPRLEYIASQPEDQLHGAARDELIERLAAM